MQKRIYLTLISCGAVLVSSCGGSGSSTSPTVGTGSFSGALPDGGQMFLEVQAPEESGDFSAVINTVKTSGGATQTSVCEGTLSDGQIQAVCEDPTGPSFNLTGRQRSNSYELVRSDLAVGTLILKPEVSATIKSRADIRFRIRHSAGGSNLGQQATSVRVPSAPADQNSSFNYYVGTADDTIPVYIFERTNGQLEIIVMFTEEIAYDMLFNNKRVGSLGSGIAVPDRSCALFLAGESFANMALGKCQVEPVG